MGRGHPPEVAEDTDKRLMKILKTEFSIKDEDIFYINESLDLTMLMKIYGQEGYDKYKTPKYMPAPVTAFQNDSDIFRVIRQKDVFPSSLYEL